MAREKMVTRSMHTTLAKVMLVNITNGITETVDVVLPTTYKDSAKMLKAVEKHYASNTDVKPVTIVSSETVEALYGMPESDFIANAVRLDPETRKRITEATATPDTEA